MSLYNNKSLYTPSHNRYIASGDSARASKKERQTSQTKRHQLANATCMLHAGINRVVAAFIDDIRKFLHDDVHL